MTQTYSQKYRASMNRKRMYRYVGHTVNVLGPMFRITGVLEIPKFGMAHWKVSNDADSHVYFDTRRINTVGPDSKGEITIYLFD